MIDFIKRAKNHLALGEHVTDFTTKHFSFMIVYLLKIRLNNVYSIIHYKYNNGQTKCFKIIFQTKWVDSTI